jgi:hypothetical protein
LSEYLFQDAFSETRRENEDVKNKKKKSIKKRKEKNRGKNYWTKILQSKTSSFQFIFNICYIVGSGSGSLRAAHGDCPTAAAHAPDVGGLQLECNCTGF